MDQVPARPDAPVPSELGGGAWRVDLVGDGLARRLERWAADARVDEAGRQKVRLHWLRRQLQEEATLRAVLVDMAERGEPVTVQLASGVGRHGRFVMVGRDVAGLVLRDGSVVLVALRAVASLRTGFGIRPSVGEPRRSGGPTLASTLADLAADRCPVTLGVVHAGSGGGSHVVSGTIRWVGHDLAAVEVEGEGQATAYVPLHAVVDVLLR